MFFKSTISGQSLLEVVIALALFSLVASAFISLTLGSISSVGYGTDFLAAGALADEGVGAVRAIRDNAWNTLMDGVENAMFDGRFNRTTTISPIDLETKALKVEVDWPSPVGRTQIVTRQTKLANWDSRDWIQTDWAGGGGQADWSDVARYNSDDGNLDISAPGELKLESVTSAGGSANPDFTSGTAGWSFAAWDLDAGEVTPTGSWQSSGGNPGGYAAIAIPANARNNLVGGYWQQAVAVPEDGLPLFCSADWRVVNWNVIGNNVDDFRFFMFLDEVPGAPALGGEVWASPPTAGVTSWNSVTDVDCSASAPVAGTYYFKIAVWLDAPPRRTGPITAGFDNAQLVWSKTSYAPNGSLVSSVFDMGDSSPVQIIGWDEQIPVCNPACTVKFKIRVADDSTMTGVSWPPDSEFFTAGGGALIPASYNGKRFVQYQVFLNGDGASTPVLQEIRLNYK